MTAAKPTPGTIVALGGGHYAVQGSHTYTQVTTTPHTLAVSIFDENILAGTVNELAAVADAALTASPVPVTAVAGSPFSGAVAQFSSQDPSASASNFSATIDWGDGDSTTGTVVAADGGFTVLGISPSAVSYAYPTSEISRRSSPSPARAARRQGRSGRRPFPQRR